jgi:hypothetical protein
MTASFTQSRGSGVVKTPRPLLLTPRRPTCRQSTPPPPCHCRSFSRTAQHHNAKRFSRPCVRCQRNCQANMWKSTFPIPQSAQFTPHAPRFTHFHARFDFIEHLCYTRDNRGKASWLILPIPILNHKKTPDASGRVQAACKARPFGKAPLLWYSWPAMAKWVKSVPRT